VRVTGIDPPANVRRLATPAVEFVGQVESLPDFYATVRVVVVPIRYGSGVKLKTVEAVQYGVPTVATVVGAEGISLDDRGAIVVADDPDRFARAVAALLADDEAWQAQRARVLTQQARWMSGAAGPVWVPLLERLTGSPPAGRSAR
jgi:glycosyltransferase involved in cell wall biosynthesis